tara:strand:+ start:117 stop:1430 length:1314 start_codon:yes stop_codon:yes gene_type:complete
MVITINNNRICEFHKKYPNVNLENILCNFIDIIEKSTGDTSNISEERVIESVGSIKNIIGDINTSNLDNFKSILKLNSYENKDDINTVLSTITNKNSELFSKNKDETTKLISDMFSKNKDLITKDNEIAFHKMQNIIPNDLIEEMKKYFIKHKTSAYKGAQSENRIEGILNHVFKDGEITNMSSVSHCGDFHLKRNNKHTIMIENKDYKNNVTYDNVTKFQNDCRDLDMHGIMLSQNSGISSKRDWSLEIINNKILIYLIDVDYDSCKIISAVSLIDNMAEQLNSIIKHDTETNINIDEDSMVEINDELKNFVTSKEEVYKVLTMNDKRMREALDKIKLTKLTSFFTGKCAALESFKCPYCPREFATKGSRGAHMCKCKFNADYNPIPTKKVKKSVGKKLLPDEATINKMEHIMAVNTKLSSECVIINAGDDSSDDD